MLEQELEIAQLGSDQVIEFPGHSNFHSTEFKVDVDQASNNQLEKELQVLKSDKNALTASLEETKKVCIS